MQKIAMPSLFRTHAATLLLRFVDRWATGRGFGGPAKFII